MLNSDYKMVADILTDKLDVTIEAIVADPDDENAAYVLTYDPAKQMRAWATHWVNLDGLVAYGNYDMTQNEGLQDLMTRAGYPRRAA